MKSGLLASVALSFFVLARGAGAEPIPDASALPAKSNLVAHRLYALGVSLASLTAREGADGGHAWAVLLSATGHDLGTRDGLAFRSDRYVALGGSNLGFVADFGLSTAIGYRLSLGRYHGPVLRAGGELWSGWTDWFALDVPTLELGYQVLTPELWFDAGVRAAFTIGFGTLVAHGPAAGAWATRPATGAYLRSGALGVELSLDAKLMHKNSDRSDLPFALIQADLCSAQTFAVCTRFLHMAAAAHHRDGSVREQDWNVVQLVAGFGFH